MLGGGCCINTRFCANILYTVDQLVPHRLWRNSRTTDSPGAAKSAEFLIRLTPGPAACALSTNSAHKAARRGGESGILVSARSRAGRYALKPVLLNPEIFRRRDDFGGRTEVRRRLKPAPRRLKLVPPFWLRLCRAVPPSGRT
jgi:hypothetical protein